MKAKLFFLLLLICPILAIGQNYFEPRFSFAQSKLQPGNINSSAPDFIEKDLTVEVGIGIHFKHSISRRILLNGGLSTSFISSKSKVYSVVPQTGLMTLKRNKTGLSRWNYSTGLTYLMSNFFSLETNIHLIQQPYKISTTYSERQVYKLTELGLSARLFFFYRKLKLGVFYYYGMKNLKGGVAQLQPFRSLGLELGYQFELKKKSKPKRRR